MHYRYIGFALQFFVLALGIIPSIIYKTSEMFSLSHKKANGHFMLFSSKPARPKKASHGHANGIELHLITRSSGSSLLLAGLYSSSGISFLLKRGWMVPSFYCLSSFSLMFWSSSHSRSTDLYFSNDCLQNTFFQYECRSLEIDLETLHPLNTSSAVGLVGAKLRKRSGNRVCSKG